MLKCDDSMSDPIAGVRWASLSRHEVGRPRAVRAIRTEQRCIGSHQSGSHFSLSSQYNLMNRASVCLRPRIRRIDRSQRSDLGILLSNGEQPTELRGEGRQRMRDIVNQGVTPTPARYGPGAVAFPWTVAGLIIFLAPLGFCSTRFRGRRGHSGSTSTSALASSISLW